MSLGERCFWFYCWRLRKVTVATASTPTPKQSLIRRKQGTHIHQHTTEPHTHNKTFSVICPFLSGGGEVKYRHPGTALIPNSLRALFDLGAARETQCSVSLPRWLCGSDQYHPWALSSPPPLGDVFRRRALQRGVLSFNMASPSPGPGQETSRPWFSLQAPQ